MLCFFLWLDFILCPSGSSLFSSIFRLKRKKKKTSHQITCRSVMLPESQATMKSNNNNNNRTEASAISKMWVITPFTLQTTLLMKLFCVSVPQLHPNITGAVLPWLQQSVKRFYLKENILKQKIRCQEDERKIFTVLFLMYN